MLSLLQNIHWQWGLWFPSSPGQDFLLVLQQAQHCKQQLSVCGCDASIAASRPLLPHWPGSGTRGLGPALACIPRVHLSDQ